MWGDWDIGIKVAGREPASRKQQKSPPGAGVVFASQGSVSSRRTGVCRIAREIEKTGSVPSASSSYPIPSHPIPCHPSPGESDNQIYNFHSRSPPSPPARRIQSPALLLPFPPNSATTLLCRWIWLWVHIRPDCYHGQRRRPSADPPLLATTFPPNAASVQATGCMLAGDRPRLGLVQCARAPRRTRLTRPDASWPLPRNFPTFSIVVAYITTFAFSG